MFHHSLSYPCLPENHFTGNIPLSICNCNSLIVLDQSKNNFTGPMPQCLTNLTCYLVSRRTVLKEVSRIYMCYAGSSLHTLDVGYNRLSGKLPKSLVNCSSLRFLSIEHNKIQDSRLYQIFKSLSSAQTDSRSFCVFRAAAHI